MPLVSIRDLVPSRPGWLAWWIAMFSALNPLEHIPLDPFHPADPLATLGPGSHAGLIVGFEPPAPYLLGPVQQHMTTAVAAGADLGRLQLDWTELEPSPGVYDDTPIVEAMALVDRFGQRPMATISTIDSTELTFPVDLMDGNGWLAPGLSFDDPVVLARFEAFVDWVVPRLQQEGIWLLALANEPDAQLVNRPQEAPAFLTFLDRGFARSRALAPELPVTVDLSADALNDTPLRADALVDRVDVVLFNLYGGFSFTPPALPAADFVRQELDAWESYADGRPMVIQELGSAAGWPSGSTIGASEAEQAAFFEAAMTELRERDALRAVVVFQLLDWSPQLFDFFFGPFQPFFPPLAYEQQRETYQTLGLLRWSDGTARPAWNAFLDGANQL